MFYTCQKHEKITSKPDSEVWFFLTCNPDVMHLLNNCIFGSQHRNHVKFLKSIHHIHSALLSEGKLQKRSKFKSFSTKKTICNKIFLYMLWDAGQLQWQKPFLITTVNCTFLNEFWTTVQCALIFDKKMIYFFLLPIKTMAIVYEKI